jgi:outer membrane protein TolC
MNRWLSRMLTAATVLTGAVCLMPSGSLAQEADTETHIVDLATVLRLAGADNLDVQLARERIEEAKANHISAVAKFLPWVTAGVNYRRHEGRTQAVDGSLLDVEKESTSIGPTITAQVDLGDAVFATLAARQYVTAATAALSAQEQDSAVAAANGYFSLLQAKALVETHREALSTSQTYEQQLQAGVGAGVVFRGDLLRVQTQTERYRIAVIQAQQQQRIASARLAELLHLDPATQLVPRDSELLPLELSGVSASVAASQADLLTQALTRRPELEQAKAQLQAAREIQKSARYGPLIPSLGAQAFLGEFGGGRDGAGGNLGTSRDYFVGLNWRFGPGGLFDFSRTRAAASRVNAAELGVEKVRTGIQRQIVEAQIRIQSAAEQMSASRSSLKNATDTLQLTRGRKQLGVGIVLEDIQAQQELVRARTDLLSAITEYNKAQYELSKALGNL